MKRRAGLGLSIELLTFHDWLEVDEPSKKTKMEWLERKKENHESILACVMEAKGKVFQEGENGKQCQILLRFQVKWSLKDSFRIQRLLEIIDILDTTDEFHKRIMWHAEMEIVSFNISKSLTLRQLKRESAPSELCSKDLLSLMKTIQAW